MQTPLTAQGQSHPTAAGFLMLTTQQALLTLAVASPDAVVLHVSAVPPGWQPLALKVRCPGLLHCWPRHGVTLVECHAHAALAQRCPVAAERSCSAHGALAATLRARRWAAHPSRARQAAPCLVPMQPAPPHGARCRLERYHAAVDHAVTRPATGAAAAGAGAVECWAATTRARFGLEVRAAGERAPVRSLVTPWN